MEAIGEGDGAITVRARVLDCDASYLSESLWSEALPAGRYVSLKERGVL